MDNRLLAGHEVMIRAVMWFIATSLMGLFFWIVGSIIWQGLPQLSWDFLTSAPQQAGRAGGIAPILVSTFWILGVCLSVSLPIGLGTAILLAETPNHQQGLARSIRGSLDVLAGMPSIIIGLFGNAFFSVTLGLGFSILSGGLTLACMVLPLMIRTTEEGLRAIPPSVRLSAGALGLSQSTTLWHLLLPAAFPSIVAGCILGIGRALAETAALIFTSGYVDRMPNSVLDSGRALSIHIYDLSMNVPGGDAHAYTSALILIILLMIINGIVHLISGHGIHRAGCTI